MKPESINEIRKELRTLGLAELSEICLKLAKFRKENKEYLHYLLFESDDPAAYTDAVKSMLEPEFHRLSSSSYKKAKELRKILSTLKRHIKYTGSKQAEAELLLWYCSKVAEYAAIRSSQKALYLLFIRQMEKTSKLINTFHDDLQFDYRQELEHIISDANTRIRGFIRNDLDL